MLLFVGTTANVVHKDASLAYSIPFMLNDMVNMALRGRLSIHSPRLIDCQYM